MKRILLWTVLLAIPVGAGALMLDRLAYAPLPRLPVVLAGDPIVQWDPEIGFTPRPNAVAHRVDGASDHPLPYDIYSDRLGARVSRPGDQTPGRVDILFIGDSMTWGPTVQAEETFSALVGRRLGVPVANLAMGSYGTVHALLQLRRHGPTLRPKVVVYGAGWWQGARNVTGCLPGFYPFCLDGARVEWRDGVPRIAPPRSNGVRRAYQQVEHERDGLWPWTWAFHGADILYGLSLDRPDARQDEALAYLMREMVEATRAIGADLVVVNIPTQGGPPLAKALDGAGYRLIDLAPQHGARPEMFMAHDGHLSREGHAIVADEIIKVTRQSVVAR